MTHEPAAEASAPASRSTPLIDRYAMGGAILNYAVDGLTPEQLRARTGPGAWSIAELVNHLLDADLVYSERMKRVVAEPNPTLLAFDQDLWAQKLNYQEADVPTAVSLFNANRQWTAGLLRRLSDDDFARAGQHSEAGRVTLAGLLATITGHLDHHLRFLYTKRANLGVALPPRYPSEALPTY